MSDPEPSEPIDLEALKRVIDGAGGEDQVVEAAWLKRVYDELAAGRAAAQALGQVFGRNGI